jgi:hypothetical protein
MVLRVAVAGNRAIPVESERDLASRIVEIFSAIEATMLSVSREKGAVYSGRSPSLRLMSGLADGVDQIASKAFLASRSEWVDRSIAAVLPFDVDTYRHRSRIDNVPRFDALLGECRYVLELSSDYAVGEETAARRARAIAYRAQSEVLLRHGDIVVAADNPGADARSGGTRETIGRALSLGLAVIYLPLTEARITVLRSAEDADRESDRTWTSDVAAIVREIFEDSRSADAAVTPPDHEWRERRLYEDELVDEFFAAAIPAPLLRRKLWSCFEKWFRRGPTPRDDSMPVAFRDWKERASALSAHYTGLYRGTFLLNYSLAVVAVCLAVASQAVLIVFPEAGGPGAVPWWLLVVFGIGNFAVVVVIQRLTAQAKGNRWNDKGVDYRYLAERIRSMAYLPRAGSLRALAPGSAGYATRVSIRSVVDWLFQAMVRDVSLEDVTPAAGVGEPIRLDPHAAAMAVRDEWIANQSHYHARNAETMGVMSAKLDMAARMMNVAVICVVGIDVVVFVLGGFGILPTNIGSAVRYLGPALLFLAAALPATVASLNSIRFQTECARLADRSTQMKHMLEVLKSHADAAIERFERSHGGTVAPTGGTIDVLHLAEDCASLTLDEVAEWSFVYAKRIVD